MLADCYLPHTPLNLFAFPHRNLYFPDHSISNLSTFYSSRNSTCTQLMKMSLTEADRARLMQMLEQAASPDTGVAESDRLMTVLLEESYRQRCIRAMQQVVHSPLDIYTSHKNIASQVHDLEEHLRNKRANPVTNAEEIRTLGMFLAATSNTSLPGKLTTSRSKPVYATQRIRTQRFLRSSWQRTARST
jgi:hypothetical protein